MLSQDIISFAILLIAISELISFLLLRRQIRQEHDWVDSRGTVGEQIGAWLLFRESEEEPTNLDVVASRVGSAMVSSINRVEGGLKSGEVRHQNMVDNKILAAVKVHNPDVADINFWLEKLGLGELASPEEIKYVMRSLERLGLGNLLGTRAQSSSKSDGRFKY